MIGCPTNLPPLAGSARPCSGCLCLLKSKTLNARFAVVVRNNSAMVCRCFCLFAYPLALLVACDQPVSLSPSNRQSPVPPGAANDLRQRQADFLNRIRAADPDHRTIDRAMLNEQNE